MDTEFVRIVNVQNVVRIINIRQIVQVVQHGTGWQVILTVGEPVRLEESEAEQLLRHLPGATPATKGAG